MGPTLSQLQPPPWSWRDRHRDNCASCPQKISHKILLKGAAREHMMFVEGGDPLDVPVESLTVTAALDPEHREGEPGVGREGEAMATSGSSRQVGTPRPSRGW